MELSRKILVTIGMLALVAVLIAVESFAKGDGEQSILTITDEEKRYLYGSRYQCQLIQRDEENQTGIRRIYWNAPEIVNLTCILENGRHSIPVYCMDGVISQLYPGDTYRRMNLEDREALSGEIGGRLRAVLLESFPYLSVEEIENRANETMGEETVRQLTQGEVLTAVQQAIWTIGSGGEYDVDRNYVSIRGLNHYDPTQFVYPESLTDCLESKYTWENIENLYRYFLEMEPMEPIKEVVSSESFQITACEAAPELDGSLTVKIIYEIAGGIGDGDELTLTASCADQMHCNEIKQGRGSIVFMGLTETEPIEITVKGYQTGGDVYLYSPEESGCELIGYDEYRLPVHILLSISAEEIRTVEREDDADEMDEGQTANNPAFTVAVDETEAKIGMVFQIIGGGFFLTAFVMLLICFLSKFRRHI